VLVFSPDEHRDANMKNLYGQKNVNWALIIGVATSICVNQHIQAKRSKLNCLSDFVMPLVANGALITMGAFAVTAGIVRR